MSADKIKNYFKAFESKNIIFLENMFSEEICLNDWEVSVIGKNNVLAFNLEVFQKFENIKVEIINIYEVGNTILSEIILYLDENLTLKVVDIIEFDKNDKIVSIRAYKG